jgi:DNA repair protein RadC
MSFTSINIYTLKQIRTRRKIWHHFTEYPKQNHGYPPGFGKSRIISIGSLDQVSVQPREVFMAAMMKRMQACVAKSIIAFHNHPSGDSTPSREEIYLSRRLQEAGKIMCIELLDHVITQERNYVSLKEKGFL